MKNCSEIFSSKYAGRAFQFSNFRISKWIIRAITFPLTGCGANRQFFVWCRDFLTFLVAECICFNNLKQGKLVRNIAVHIWKRIAVLMKDTNLFIDFLRNEADVRLQSSVGFFFHVILFLGFVLNILRFCLFGIWRRN